MPVGDVCKREVVTVEKGATVQTVAGLMRDKHVGDVVVVEKDQGKVRPVGVITDRDIVKLVVAENIDLRTLRAEDIMVRELVAAGQASGLFETIRLMSEKGVRRVPVVDEKGDLFGLLSSDDLLLLLADEFSGLAHLFEKEIENESKGDKGRQDKSIFQTRP